VNWARWSDIWTAPDSMSAVVPAVGLGRAVAAGGEMAVERSMSVWGVGVEAAAAAVFIAGAGVEVVERRGGDVAE
jgi:hypothetical protein